MPVLGQKIGKFHSSDMSV